MFSFKYLSHSSKILENVVNEYTTELNLSICQLNFVETRNYFILNSFLLFLLFQHYSLHKNTKPNGSKVLHIFKVKN